MPAEIKAKLELVSGGTPAAAGGAPASDSSSESLKDIARQMKKPQNMFGSKSEHLSIGKTIGEALTLALGGWALGTQIGEEMGKQWLEVATEIRKIFAEKPIDLPASPAYTSPDLNIVPGARVGGFWDRIEAVDEIQKINKEIIELQKDGVTFSEQIKINELAQAENLFKLLAYDKDMTVEEETRINLQLSMIGYQSTLTSGAGSRLSAEQKVTAELNKQAEILAGNKGNSKTPEGTYSAQIGEYTYTGRIDTIPGKFVGIRTVR